MPSFNIGGNQAQAQQSGGGVAPIPPGQSDNQYTPRNNSGVPQFGGGSGSPSGGGSSRADDDALPGGTPGRQYLPSTPSVPVAPKRPPSSRPRSLRPAVVMGDRDWVIFVECRENSVVVYPSRQEIPVSYLSRDPNNPLMRLVQQMINQKQASVRPGDLPYRPHISFLVRPEYERSYNQSFPSLDMLTEPKSRRTLDSDEDVQEIVATGR